jgi:UDP-sugar transporter A1/2/3
VWDLSSSSAAEFFQRLSPDALAAAAAAAPAGEPMLEKKYLFLLLLIVQNTSKTLIMRAAVGGKANFLYSAAVLATEGLKATASAVWVLNTGGSPASIVHFLRSEWRTSVRVMVPAAFYNVQQVLEYVALSKLDAPVFAVIVQIKLLTTALFSWIMLGKQLRAVQLVALVLLMVGVILAQMKDGQTNHLDFDATTSVGVSATLTIAMFSGFAAVYTEKVLKHAPLVAHSTKDDSVLPYMQIQMALASLLIIGVFALVSDFLVIVEYGLWRGFDGRAIVAVISSALGGLIVSAVLKYADAVLKGYATATSVILTGILSALLFGTTLDLHFVLAVVNVTCSILLYGSLGGSPSPTAPARQGTSEVRATADERAPLQSTSPSQCSVSDKKLDPV